jgi:hypothetical protein
MEGNFKWVLVWRVVRTCWSDREVGGDHWDHPLLCCENHEEAS